MLNSLCEPTVNLLWTFANRDWAVIRAMRVAAAAGLLQCRPSFGGAPEWIAGERSSAEVMTLSSV